MATTVTGYIRTLATATSGSANESFVRFILRGARGNQPRVSGTGVIAPLTSKDGMWYCDLPADASGYVSGTIYSTRDAAGTGGGDIEVGGVSTAVWYGMVIYSGGVAGPETAIHAKSEATLDPSSVPHLDTVPVVSAPDGDATYLRLDGVNSPVTGAITFDSAISVTDIKASGTLKNAAATATMGMTMKQGLGSGSYTTTSATFVDMDATNLSYSVLIPAGWKALVTASMWGNNSSGGGGVAIRDGGTNVTQVLFSAAGSNVPINVDCVITGDGATHVITLGFHSIAGTTTIQDDPATNAPKMIVLLMPSN